MKLIKKICKECGEEFIARNGMQKFCDKQHYRSCKICGKLFEVTRYHLTAKDAKTTCSKECMRKLAIATNIARFGYAAPISNPEVRARAEATSLEKYGVAHPAQSQECKDKAKETIRAKYGCDYYQQTEEYHQIMKDYWSDPEFREKMIQATGDGVEKKYGEGTRCVFSVPEIREKCRTTYEAKTGYSEPFANPEVQRKSEETNLKNLGTRRPLQSEVCKSKWKATNLERYGAENPMQNLNVQRKAQATCLEVYGNTCYLQSTEGIAKTAALMNEKFGADNYLKSRDRKISCMSDPAKINNLMEFDKDPADYIAKHFDHQPTIRELRKSIGVSSSDAITSRVTKANCTDLVAYVYSYMEREIYDAVRSIDPCCIVDRNTHKIITPLELDLYLPEYKLGIECNPTSTHNSSENTYGCDPVPADYHKMKADKCDSKDVRLFHIYGSQWTYGKHIVVSMLRDLMNKPLVRISASDCQLQQISEEDRREFLLANYLYGDLESSYCIGLYHEDELVELLVYNNDRIVCICHKLNTEVEEGPNTLICKLAEDLSLDTIHAVSHRNTNEDDLFQQLGFTKINILPPSYVWTSVRTDLSYVPNSPALKQLVDCDVTDDEAMLQNRLNKVYDSGTITWEWRRDT